MTLLQLVVVLVLWAAAFAWMGAALSQVFSKLALAPATAWIPVFRYVNAARGAEISPMPVAIIRGVAALAWLTFVSTVVIRAADAQAASPGLAAVAGIAFAVAAISSVIGWALWVMGSSTIELKLGVAQRLWWLAAALPPLWATLVGFGQSRPVVAGPITGSVPQQEEDKEEADDATRAIQRVPVTVSPSASAQEEPQSPTPLEGAMTTEPFDITGQSPRVYSPYDRVAPPRDPAPASAPPPVVDRPPAWIDDDDDATFYAKRHRARWVLRIIGGEEYDLDDVTTIGREGIRPIPGVLAIIDDTRTISKLHARLRREADNWYVTDLGSTNGTYVRDDKGNEIEVPANSEAKVVGTLLLGDLEANIVDQREGA